MAEYKYKSFTGKTKSEQLDEIRRSLNIKNPEWKNDHYRINSSFHVSEREGVDEYLHNNTRQNIPLLDRALETGALDFSVKDQGFFPKPKDKLYSKHYIPIAR